MRGTSRLCSSRFLPARPTAVLAGFAVLCGILGLPFRANAGPIVVEKYPGKEFQAGNFSSTGQYRPSNVFSVEGIQNQFLISAVPAHPVQANEANSSVDFKNVLQKAFGDWTFNYTGKDGKDLSLFNSSLIVGTYDVKTGIQPVLMQFYLNYDIKKAADNKAPSDKSKLHWIQVSTYNWPLQGSGKSLYTVVSEVDNNGNKTNPYYDSVFNGDFNPDPNKGNPDAGLGLPYLSDDPKRIDKDLVKYDSTKPNGGMLYDYFETFLAVEVGPKTVDIYDGVQWGFTVTMTPEPGSITLLLIGAVCASPWFLRSGSKGNKTKRTCGS